ncbi:MAG: DoxX family protein [Phycisphaerae bacterium]
MTPAQFSVGPVPTNRYPQVFPGNLLTRLGIPTPKQTLTYYPDMAMMVGLTVIGACLILGLFTRLASLGGAVMLLMFYLAMPPFPGAHVPESAAEGHYLFVNKNLIEMLALLMIATSRVGRWFGLDALIHALFGRNVAVPAEAPVAAASVPTVPAAPAQGRVYIPETRAGSRDGGRG